jgi:hypothetical protein
MEKDVYKIVQDWHDLYKSGAITEAEFSDKKYELLTGKKPAKRSVQTVVDAEVLHEDTEQPTAEEYMAQYEDTFGKKTWWQHNKTAVIISSILCIIAVGIYFYLEYAAAATNVSGRNGAYVDQCYRVISPRSYFHNSPDVSTRRRAFLIATNAGGGTIRPLSEADDFVYIEFTNDLGQTSKGWILKHDIAPCE